MQVVFNELVMLLGDGLATEILNEPNKAKQVCYVYWCNNLKEFKDAETQA